MIAKTIQANPAEPAPRLALVGLYLKSKDAKKAVSAAQDAVAAAAAGDLVALGRLADGRLIVGGGFQE
mgnify:CR=1 FL=1